jgi:hypothetical protein
MMNAGYHYLDLVPKGRDEAGQNLILRPGSAIAISTITNKGRTDSPQRRRGHEEGRIKVWV